MNDEHIAESVRVVEARVRRIPYVWPGLALTSEEIVLLCEDDDAEDGQ